MSKVGSRYVTNLMSLYSAVNPWTQKSLNLRSEMGLPIFSSSEWARLHEEVARIVAFLHAGVDKVFHGCTDEIVGDLVVLVDRVL